jgi:hypothetical protein
VSRRGLAPALLLIAACGGGAPSGLPDAVASKVEFCQQMRGDVLDWCVFESIQGVNNIPAQPFYALCRDMRDEGAHDACLELFSRVDSSSGYDTLCDEIHQERMRESCFLTTSERLMRGNASVQEIVAACRKAGSLEPHCLAHFPAQRTSFWMQSGGPSAMAAEIYSLEQLEPDLGSMDGVGFAIGIAIQSMGGANGSALCASLGSGTAAQSCYKVLSGAAGGGAGALPPVGSPYSRPAP